ncbi:MAG: hypothetical protein HZB46_05150 [Solirubrobacterales bacterium]|nr:hypothetical protein [Solirubrobacterales bacterium]
MAIVVGVGSVLVLCRAPRHLTAGQARSWLGEQLCAVEAMPGVGDAALVELEAPSRRFPRHWAWLVRVGLADGQRPGALLESRPWTTWVGDLRLLGMDPAIVVPAGEVALP